MKRRLTIMMAIIAAGITAQSQTLVVSDSFDTGGVATNDLNYNIGTRQAGTAAPMNYTVNTNIYPISLTAAGKLNMKSDGSWYSVDMDSLSTELGSGSFSIKWNVQHAVKGASWSMMTVLSDVNNNWDSSPMSINSWAHDFLHMDYGTSNNVGANQLRVDMPGVMVSEAIGATYKATDLHELELRASAANATSGTYSFSVDGNILAAGLPYAFEDGAKHIRLNAGGATDAELDDLEISTISQEAPPEYLFFDNFDVADVPNGNWTYGVRQTNGLVIAPWTGAPGNFEIKGNKLHEYKGGPMYQSFDFGGHLANKDFKFSFKLTTETTGGEWTAIYLYDETSADGRGDSRLGMHVQGLAEPWACVVYRGTGAGQQTYPIDPAWYPALAGYDKTQEHTFEYISTAGTGGTNTFELFIDGVEIFDGTTAGMPDAVPYYFDGAERRIGIIGIMPDDITKGVYIDDLYLEVFKGNTYADWVADDTGLTEGANDARTDDPDGDKMDNLLEYALGGDPLVDDAVTILPVSDYSVADSISYVFRRRIDASTRGLTYDVLVNLDGLELPWINKGSTLESGSAIISPEFEAVTNTLDITGNPAGFLNLKVTED